MNSNKRSIYLDLLALCIVFIACLWIPFFMERNYLKEKSRVESLKTDTEISTLKRGTKMSESLNDVRRMIEEEKIHYIRTGGTEESFYAAVEMMLKEMETDNRKEDQE